MLAAAAVVVVGWIVFSFAVPWWAFAHAMPDGFEALSLGMPLHDVLDHLTGAGAAEAPSVEFPTSSLKKFTLKLPQSTADALAAIEQARKEHSPSDAITVAVPAAAGRFGARLTFEKDRLKEARFTAPADAGWQVYNDWKADGASHFLRTCKEEDSRSDACPTFKSCGWESTLLGATFEVNWVKCVDGSGGVDQVLRRR